jgi:hypothetical protein
MDGTALATLTAYATETGHSHKVDTHTFNTVHSIQMNTVQKTGCYTDRIFTVPRQVGAAYHTDRVNTVQGQGEAACNTDMQAMGSRVESC